MLTSGAPQGSTGPLLFLVYVNHLQIFSFADDTKLLSATPHRSSNNMQTDIDRLQNWSIANFIDFNEEKCAVLNFLCSSPTNYDLMLGEKSIQTKTTEKYLDAMVNKTLRWTNHVEYVIAKATKVFFPIKRNVSPAVCMQTKLNLYKIMLLPILLYGSHVWWLSKMDTKTIESFQHRPTRWIVGGHLPYRVRLKMLKILRLYD